MSMAVPKQFQEEQRMEPEIIQVEAEEALRELYPYGHKEFIPILVGLAKLHSEKNHDYAKGGDPLGNFDRVGTILSLYPGLDPGNPVVVLMTYLLKQLDAVLWGLAKNIKHVVEGFQPRLRDIAVYAIIAMCKLGWEKRNEQS